MAINLRIVCGLWRNVVTLSMLSPLSPSILFPFLFDEGMATKSSFRGGWEGRGRLRKTKGYFRSLHRLLYSNFRRTKISSINLSQQFQGISSLGNLFWIFRANFVSPQPRSQGPTENEVGVTHLVTRRYNVCKNGERSSFSLDTRRHIFFSEASQRSGILKIRVFKHCGYFSSLLLH